MLAGCGRWFRQSFRQYADNFFCNDLLTGERKVLLRQSPNEMNRILVRSKAGVRIADIIGYDQIETLFHPFFSGMR